MNRLIFILLMASFLFSGDNGWSEPVLIDVVEIVIGNESTDCAKIELVYRQVSRTKTFVNYKPVVNERLYKIVYIFDGWKWRNSDRIYVTLEQETINTYPAEPFDIELFTKRLSEDLK